MLALTFLLMHSTIFSGSSSKEAIRISEKHTHCAFILGFGTLIDDNYGNVINDEDMNNGWFDLAASLKMKHVYSLTRKSIPRFCDSSAITNYDTVVHAWSDKNLTKVACEAIKSPIEDSISGNNIVREKILTNM